MESPSPLETPSVRVRLQKAIADAGIASRRRAEELIATRRVRVNGETVTEKGVLVDPTKDKIVVDGKPLPTPGKRHYIALHKPVGYVSTVSDPYAQKIVTELINLPGVALKPAGRLDADSEGLMLLSDDGDFIYKVTHPSKSIGKVYVVTVKGSPAPEVYETLAKGLMIPGEARKTAQARVVRIGKGERGTTLLEMTLHEGRKRQIRRMLETVGHPVIRLVRVEIGPVKLGVLALGAWRSLTAKEIEAILTGMPYNSPKPAAETQNRGEDVTQREISNRRGARPGPRQDQREPTAKRVPIHQTRLNGGVPPRGQRDPSNRSGGQGSRKSPRPDRRGKQDP